MKRNQFRFGPLYNSWNTLTGYLSMWQKVAEMKNRQNFWNSCQSTPIWSRIYQAKYFWPPRPRLAVAAILNFEATNKMKYLFVTSYRIFVFAWWKYIKKWIISPSYRLGPCTVGAPWQKNVRKINFFKIFLHIFNQHNFDYMWANFHQNYSIFHFWALWARCAPRNTSKMKY